jgi:hypothetical protein
MRILIIVFLLFPFLSGAQPNHLVISQVYGGGGNSGALYTNDFIEIFNPTLQPLDLNGYSLQYTSATGSSWTGVVSLTGIIPSKKYFLVQMAGGTNGNALPSPDQTSSINMSAASGKIALVNAITALSGSCPLSLMVIDFVGFGSANCFELAAAPTGSNTLAVVRKSAGCLDSDNNAIDFISASPSPKNSQSAPMDCSGQNANLPIFFSNEKAGIKNGKFEISWSNETESEVVTYSIEGSSNALDFSLIKIVAAYKNDGTRATYSEPVSGTGHMKYFRLQGLESDGNKTYSKVFLYSGPVFNSIAIYPNPVINELNLNLDNADKGSCRISVYNAYGTLVKELTLPDREYRSVLKITVQNLPAGLYYVAINGNMGGRFVKVNE